MGTACVFGCETDYRAGRRLSRLRRAKLSSRKGLGLRWLEERLGKREGLRIQLEKQDTRMVDH